MIFQDPRAHVNPVRRIGDFMTEALRANRDMATADARARAVDLQRGANAHSPSGASNADNGRPGIARSRPLREPGSMRHEHISVDKVEADAAEHLTG